VRLAPENAEALFSLVQKRGKRRAVVIIQSDMSTVADRAPAASGGGQTEASRSRPVYEPDLESMSSLRRAHAAPYGELPGWRVDAAPVTAPSRYSTPPPFPGTSMPELSN
jgi:hypothetical protein